MKDKKRVFSSFRNVIYFLSIIFKIKPKLVLMDLIESILIKNLTWAIYTLFFTAKLFSMFEEEAPFESIVILVLGFALFFLFSSMFSSWYNEKYKVIQVEELNYKFLERILKKASSVDISCYENKNFYDTYMAALKETETRAINILDCTCDLIGSLAAAIFFMVILIRLNYFLVLFILVPVLLSSIFQFIGVRIKYEFQQEKIPYERKIDYIQRMVMLKKSAKDIRTSNVLDVFKKTYDEGYHGIGQVIDKYKNKIFLRNTFSSIFGMPLSFYSGWLYTAYLIMVDGSLHMSDYILIATAIVDARFRVQIFLDDINKLIEHGMFVQNYKKMMDYRPKIDQNQKGVIPASVPKILEFRNVSFTYEGQTEATLKNINMKIKVNSTIALFGHNGAGKTTLVKLIMRLYDVTEGEILLDGINIKEYDLKEYRQLIATVFQQPQIFALSIRDNIMMSNDSKQNQTSSDNNIFEALRLAGLYDKVQSLPNGINSVLTKEFDNDGVELSGGEYQKLAVSRAIYRNSPIIILDEPSSALDPIAEDEIYNNIKKISDTSKNKMMIIISHRMSCALISDQVIYLEKGRILECGSHADLMKKNGKYKMIFNKQRKSYEMKGEAFE